MKKTLDIFHTAILENDVAPAIPTIKKNPRITPEAQMAIYTEGYRIRLTSAICSDYPALLNYLGEGEFERLALIYIENNPPEGFNLDRYPHRFFESVRENSDDDFAGDLAALESAIANVFMLPDSEPLDARLLATLLPEDFSALILKPRTASILLPLAYPVDDYLRMQRDVSPLPQAGERGKYYIFLVRHNNEVKRHALEQSEYALLTQLCEGKPVGSALESANIREEDLERWFARWIAEGFFS